MSPNLRKGFLFHGMHFFERAEVAVEQVSGLALQRSVEEGQQVGIHDPDHLFPVERAFESELRGNGGEQGQVAEVVVARAVDEDGAL